MCERYVIADQMRVERELVPDEVWWKFEASFNVAPGRHVPVLRSHDGRVEGVLMRWGLIPPWAEGKPIKGNTAHVHADGIAGSELYGRAWLHGQRCIVPMSGFYAWQLTPQKHRQPFFVGLRDRRTLAVAGLWERSVTEDDDVIESCALITVVANSLLEQVHNTARTMPAILSRESCKLWLSGTPVQARSLLSSFPAGEMLAHPVSPRVNALKYDDERLIRPEPVE